jgi:hypothetical protein
MAESVASWLAGLNSLYTPLPTHFDAAKSHRGSIEARLDYVIGVHRMFEIGSLRQGTGVWQFSDADYLASLKGIRPASSTTTLNKVREALMARFPTTTISVRSPAVVCRFSDCEVEVVPGYVTDTTSGYGYWIADPTLPGGWMKTYPAAHNEYVNTVNRKFNGGVKTLARQLKVWKYKRQVPISSCYLEIRAAKYMDGQQSYNQIYDLYLALSNLHTASLAAMNDPTGLGSRFTACSSDATRADALSKLSTAVSRASKALDHYRQGNEAMAIEQLKLLFNR